MEYKTTKKCWTIVVPSKTDKKLKALKWKKFVVGRVAISGKVSFKRGI